MNETLPIETKPAKSWRRRKSARPGEILEAALRVFAAKGYAAARMEDIAQAAGVTKGTIYLYYPSKEEVFKSLGRDVVGTALKEFNQRALHFPGTAQQALEMALHAIADFLRDEDRIALPKIILAESGTFPELAKFWCEEVIFRALGMMKHILERGIKSGEFRDVPVDYTVRLCIAPVILAVIWRTTFAPLIEEPFDADDFFATHLDMLRRGLKRDQESQRGPKSGNRFSDPSRDQKIPPEGKAP